MSTTLSGRQKEVDERAKALQEVIENEDDIEQLRKKALDTVSAWSYLFRCMHASTQAAREQRVATQVQLQRYGLDPLQPVHERVTVEQAQTNILLDRAMLDALDPAEQIRLLGPMLMDSDEIEDRIYDLLMDDEDEED